MFFCVAGKTAGRHFIQIGNNMTRAVHQLEQGSIRADQHITTQHHISPARANADGRDIFRGAGQPDMAGHRAAFLGQTRHINNAAALAFKMGRHPQQRRNGDHPCAADTGQHIRDRCIKADRRFRKRQGFITERSGGRFAQRPARHRHKAGAEAVDTGEILVTGRLVNFAFAA